MELKTVNLTKAYQKTLALDGATLSFTPGIYGLLGPNGSGKSTLMNLITGNILPTSGQVLWEGKEILRLGKEYRSLVGYVPQQQALYPEFSVEMFLSYMAALKGLSGAETKRQIRQVLEWVDLSQVGGYRIRMLSGGMKQRLLIAQAVLGSPKVLIMDEPTVGLDPNQRQQIRNLIRDMSEGKIVLIATHIVSDLERLSDEVILLKKGKVILRGDTDAVIARTQKDANREISSLEDVYLYHFGEQKYGENDSV